MFFEFEFKFEFSNFEFSSFSSCKSSTKKTEFFEFKFKFATLLSMDENQNFQDRFTTIQKLRKSGQIQSKDFFKEHCGAAIKQNQLLNTALKLLNQINEKEFESTE